MTPAPRPKAFGYVRVSTAEQAKSGLGLDVQRAEIRAYARTHGLRLLDILADEGISGSNGLDTRQGLAEAVQRIEAGDATVLLVYKHDRLARDMFLQLTIAEQLRKAGAEVISATEEIEGPDEVRSLVRNVLGAVAQYERMAIRTRMAGGRAAKAARGGYAYGRPPLGFRAEGRELVPEPSEQVVVARVLALREQGRSYREIADTVAAEGHKPKKGDIWHPQQIARILQRAERD